MNTHRFESTNRGLQEIITSPITLKLINSCKTWARCGSTDGYVSSDGESRWNNSRVGYFPIENPQYSITCIVTYKTDKQYPGNDIPAKINNLQSKGNLFPME